MWRKRIFAGFLCLLLLCQPVMASWLSWASAGCTVAAVGCAFFPPGGTVAAGVLAMVQCVGLAIDVIGTVRYPAHQWLSDPGLAQRPPSYYDEATGQYVTWELWYEGTLAQIWMPVYDDNPPSLSGDALELIDAEFQAFDMPAEGSWSYSLIGATNAMIEATNVALMAARDPMVPNEELTGYIYEVACAVQVVSEQFDACGDIPIDQAFMDDSQDWMAANGLPPIEVDILTAAGMSQDCQDAIALYCVTLPLDVLDTSAGELIAAMPGSIWPDGESGGALMPPPPPLPPTDPTAPPPPTGPYAPYTPGGY